MDKVYVIIFRNASNLMITKESQDSNTYAIITTLFKATIKIKLGAFNSRSNIYLFYRHFPQNFKDKLVFLSSEERSCKFTSSQFCLPRAWHLQLRCSPPPPTPQRPARLCRPSECKPGKRLLSYSPWKGPPMRRAFRINGSHLVFKVLESPLPSRPHPAALPLPSQPQPQGAAPSPLCFPVCKALAETRDPSSPISPLGENS